MNPRIKRLHDARLHAEAEIRSTLEQAETEKRDLSAEDTTKIETAERSIAELNDTLGALIDAEARSAEVDAGLGGLPGPAEVEDRSVDADIETELRSFLLGDSSKRYVDVTEQRNLVKGTNSAGGYTVPTSFYRELQEYLIAHSAILGAGATILNTTSGETLQIPVVSGVSSAAITAEAAQFSTSEPTFAQRTLGAYKYGFVMYVARELVEDTAVNLLGFLAKQAGSALGDAFGTHLVSGDGSSKPTGILNNTTLGVTGSTSVVGVFTADNLIDLKYSVIEPNRRNAKWLMNDASVGALRKFKDSNGQYLFQPSLVAGTPDRLLGDPIFTDPNMPTTAVAAKSVAYGDISAYWVRKVNAIRFERSDDFKFDTDLVAYRAVLRGDGTLVDRSGAVKHFIGGAS